jgi:uncharacterized protein YdaU (DUF1376 family)
MARAPWMAFYWSDYLADTQHLTTEEHGAYLLLIGAYWSRRRPLPEDDRFFAAVTKMSVKKWKMVCPKIREFFDISAGHWTHHRVEKELLRSNARSTAAQRGGNASCATRARVTTTTTTTKEEDIEKPSLRSVKKKPRAQIGDFVPDEAEAAAFWASKDREDISAFEQAQQFRDHHLKLGNTMADWRAAWRTWYREAVNRVRKPYEPRKSSRANSIEGAALWLRDEEIRNRRNSSEAQPALPAPQRS